MVRHKRELGLHGNLRGRHLSVALRAELLKVIEEAKVKGTSLEESCRILELNLVE